MASIWTTFGIIWATFCSNNWSHCLEEAGNVALKISLLISGRSWPPFEAWLYRAPLGRPQRSPDLRREPRQVRRQHRGRHIRESTSYHFPPCVCADVDVFFTHNNNKRGHSPILFSVPYFAILSTSQSCDVPRQVESLHILLFMLLNPKFHWLRQLRLLWASFTDGFGFYFGCNCQS